MICYTKWFLLTWYSSTETVFRNHDFGVVFVPCTADLSYDQLQSFETVSLDIVHSTWNVFRHYNFFVWAITPYDTIVNQTTICCLTTVHSEKSKRLKVVWKYRVLSGLYFNCIKRDSIMSISTFSFHLLYIITQYSVLMWRQRVRIALMAVCGPIIQGSDERKISKW